LCPEFKIRTNYLSVFRPDISPIKTVICPYLHFPTKAYARRLFTVGARGDMVAAKFVGAVKGLQEWEV